MDRTYSNPLTPPALGLAALETCEASAEAASDAVDAYAFGSCLSWRGWDEAEPAERDELLQSLHASLRWLALTSGLIPDTAERWNLDLGAAAGDVPGRAEAAFWPTDADGAPDPVAAPRTDAWAMLLVDADWPGAAAVDTAWSEDSVQRLAAAAAAAEAAAMNTFLAEASGLPAPESPWWDPTRAQVIAPVSGTGAIALPVGTADLLSRATDAVLARLAELHLEVAAAALADLAVDAEARGIRITVLDDAAAIESARRGEHVLRYWSEPTGPHYALSPSLRSVEELRHLLAQHPRPGQADRAGASTATALAGIRLHRWTPAVGVEA